MLACGVITLISLNNWFYPLEEFLQMIGCQEHGQDNRNYARYCFWRAWFLSLLAVEGMSRSAFLSQFLSCTFEKWYIWFYLIQKKDMLVFLCRKHINWKFLYSFWPLLAQEETLSHALRVERVWHFVAVHKGDSSQYFNQAKVSDKEVLTRF